MDYIFEVIDKIGRKIHLTKERWRHTISPTSLHAYMTNYLEEIKQTLINPDKIISSVNKNKVNYYRYYKERKQYLRIIVKYLNSIGFVITAYFIKNIG